MREGRRWTEDGEGGSWVPIIRTSWSFKKTEWYACRTVSLEYQDCEKRAPTGMLICQRDLTGIRRLAEAK